METGFDVGFDERGNLERLLDGKEVMKLIEAIPEMYRDALIMRYVDDLSVQEIAEITGETENNISVRIHRALDKVRTLAEDHK